MWNTPFATPPIENQHNDPYLHPNTHSNMLDDMLLVHRIYFRMPRGRRNEPKKGGSHAKASHMVEWRQFYMTALNAYSG